MTCLFALTRRAASLGEQAMKGLTPACRGCNAGDGPCAPNDFVHANDAWAKYLHQKSKQVPRNSSAKRPAPVVDRARWIDCKVDMSQFEDSLSQLLPDQFQSSATGVAMLSRPLFLEASSVRSPEPLAVILPGQQNRDLVAAGFPESAFECHFLYVQDPVQDKYFRKRVTIVQLGVQPVKITVPKGDAEWKVEDSTEFALFLSKDISSQRMTGRPLSKILEERFVDCMLS